MPLLMLAVTGMPMMFAPLVMMKVSLPWLTVPAVLVTLALRVTALAAALKVAEALEAVSVVAVPGVAANEKERGVVHGRQVGILGVVGDLGRDLRGVDRAPVIVGQIDRGIGVTRGDDRAVAEIVVGDTLADVAPLLTLSLSGQDIHGELVESSRR